MSTAARGLSRRPPTSLDEALGTCRRAFGVVALFSLVINLLMLASPLYMLQVYDRVLTTGRYATLALLTVMAAAALLILGALDALRAAVMSRIGRWLNARLGPELLATSLRARLLGDGAGAQPLRDLAQIQGFVGGQGLAVLFDAPWIPVFVALVWLLHPLLGLVALVAALVLLALGVANELATRAPAVKASQAQIAAAQQAEAAIRNAEAVCAMGMQAAVVRRWSSLNEAALAATQLAAERGGAFVGCTKFLRLFVQVAILGAGASLVLKGELTSGGMVAASILLGRALAPVEQAMGAWRNFTSTRLAYGRLKTRLASLPREPARTRLLEPVGRLSVENLTHVAHGSDRVVLQQVSFALEPGEALAVIGPSAAGKSMLCRLLVGIAVPTRGHVRLDGAEIQHWNVEELGRYVGYLPQDVELFAGTVRENIARLGDGPDEAVVEAAQLAHAHEMILSLAEGYDTQIGEGGIRLSGGQRQRIGLARALFGRPKLVVLDEPDANLDQAGESALAAAVAELKRQGTTLVIIGHRPSTLLNVDKVLVLNEGRGELYGPREEVPQRMRQPANQAAGPRPAEAPAARVAVTPAGAPGGKGPESPMAAARPAAPQAQAG